jgi:hypothetical protein
LTALEAQEAANFALAFDGKIQGLGASLTATTVLMSLEHTGRGTAESVAAVLRQAAIGVDNAQAVWPGMIFMLAPKDQETISANTLMAIAEARSQASQTVDDDIPIGISDAEHSKVVAASVPFFES